MTKKKSVNAQGNIGELLKSVIGRVEALQLERAEINGDISDVVREAKSNGLSLRHVREIIKLRKLDDTQRAEDEYTIGLYKRAMGLEAESGE